MSANECGSPPGTVSVSVSTCMLKYSFAIAVATDFFFLPFHFISFLFYAMYVCASCFLKSTVHVHVDHCFEQWLVILMIKCFAGQTFFEFGINLWIHIGIGRTGKYLVPHKVIA